MPIDELEELTETSAVDVCADILSGKTEREVLKMKFRWTMQELKGVTNKRLLIALISERKSELNGYCPLSRRLTELEKWVEKNIA